MLKMLKDSFIITENTKFKITMFKMLSESFYYYRKKSSKILIDD